MVVSIISSSRSPFPRSSQRPPAIVFVPESLGCQRQNDCWRSVTAVHLKRRVSANLENTLKISFRVGIGVYLLTVLLLSPPLPIQHIQTVNNEEQAVPSLTPHVWVSILAIKSHNSFLSHLVQRKDRNTIGNINGGWTQFEQIDWVVDELHEESKKTPWTCEMVARPFRFPQYRNNQSTDIGPSPPAFVICYWRMIDSTDMRMVEGTTSRVIIASRCKRNHKAKKVLH